MQMVQVTVNNKLDLLESFGVYVFDSSCFELSFLFESVRLVFNRITQLH